MRDNERDALVALADAERKALEGLLSNLANDAGDVDDEDAYWAYHTYHAIQKLKALAAPAEGAQEEVAEYQFRCPKAADNTWRRMSKQEYDATVLTGHACGNKAWTRDVELRKLYTTPPAASVDVEGLRNLSAQIRPGSEAAPWVCKEIKRLIDSAGGAKGECCVPDAGEPSFVFLGRDPQAPTLIEQWADERERAEPDSTKPAAARDIARRMRKFKNANPDKGLPASAITPQPAEGDGAVLPAGYKVQRHIFGKWMYVVGDHGSANYWDTRDEAVQKAWSHHERQLTRLAATAVVPDAPLKVFDSGPWIYEPDGVRFSGQQLDGAAFAEYRRLLAAAPAAPKGGVVVTRELAEKVQDALGRFVGDEGWCGADMETADAFSAALANQEQS